ncbi:methyl-accepting chemotaxis protein [Bradyrhizobium sp. GM22.5]
MSEAVQAIEGVSGTISSINEIAIAIASAVEQQGVATREIARSIQQVAQGTEDVSRNIVGVSEASAQTGVAAADVFAAAGGLNQPVHFAESGCRSLPGKCSGRVSWRAPSSILKIDDRHLE